MRKRLTSNGHPGVEGVRRRLTLRRRLLTDRELAARVVMLLLRLWLLVLRVLAVHDARAAAVLRHAGHVRARVDRARAPRVVVGADGAGPVRAGRHGRLRDAVAHRVAAADDAPIVDVVVTDDVVTVRGPVTGDRRSGRRRRRPRTDRVVVRFGDARRSVAVLVGLRAVEFVLLLV